MSKKFLDQTGLSHLWTTIKSLFTGKVDKVTGKDLSTNDFTDEYKTKLDGITTGATKVTVDSALSSSSTNPVQNKVINTALGNKVDKVSGKGLSTNDFTSTYKDKIDNIEEGAQKNNVVYTGLKTYTIEETLAALTLEYNELDDVARIVVNVTSSSAAESSTTSYSYIFEKSMNTDLENDTTTYSYRLFNEQIEYDVSITSIEDGTFTYTEKQLLSGKVDKVSGKGLSTNDFTNEYKEKLDNLSDDLSGTFISGVVIKYGEEYTEQENAAGYGMLDLSDFAKKVDVSGLYTPKGTVAFANLPALNEASVGDVYNISDEFTTSSSFLEGTGKVYPAGTNVVCVDSSGTKLWDVLAGFIDLSSYQKSDDLVAISTSEIDTIINS